MPVPTSNGAAAFTVVLGDVQFALSGSGGGQMTMTGRAVVYGHPSHDLGGFRTVIAPAALDAVLATNPDVHLLIDHDTRFVLARTKNSTLELRSEPDGVHVWARFANTSYARDLMVLMERGDVDQMSFACDIGEDEWTQDADGNLTRTITEVSALYDVTVCAQGAFPQTSSQLVASYKQDADDILAAAVAAGRVPGRADMSETVAHDDRAGVTDANAADDDGRGARNLAAFKLRTRARLARLHSD